MQRTKSERTKSCNDIAKKTGVIPADEDNTRSTTNHAIFSTYRGKGGSTCTALTTGLIINDYLHGGTPTGIDFDGQMHMSHNENRFAIPENKGGKTNTQRAFSYIKGMQKYPEEIEALDALSLSESEAPIMDEINSFADDHGFKTGKDIRIIVGYEKTASEAYDCAKEYQGYKNMSVALRRGCNELKKVGNVYIDCPSAVLDRSPTNVAASVADHILMPFSDIDGAKVIPDFIMGMYKSIGGRRAVFEEYGANANGISGKKPSITIIRSNVDLLEISRERGKIYRGLNESAKALVENKVTPDPIHAMFLDKVPEITLKAYIKHSIYVKNTPFDDFVDNHSHKNVLMEAANELSRKVESGEIFNIFENQQNKIAGLREDIKEYQMRKKQ
jgi:hypothetical protein